MGESLVEWFGFDSGHSCGYCKGEKTSLTHGMWGHQLSHADYQALIDRGWRRSGKYLYKPDMSRTCCPQYTIRCDADAFRPTKSQKKIIKRFRNFLVTGRRPGGKDDGDDEAMEEEGDGGDSGLARLLEKGEARVKMSKKEVEEEATVESSGTEETIEKKGENEIEPAQPAGTSSLPSPSKETRKREVRAGEGADPNRPKARKAKDLRRERAMAKNKEPKPPKNSEKTLEDLIDEPLPPDAAHTFSVRTVWANTRHNPEFRGAAFDEELAVYQDYQVRVHGDERAKCSASQFTRFLCDASLRRAPLSGQHCYGAFHQQYLIDGKIVCVGVVDVLARCVSSVYLFYDPAYRFLSLGTLSTLYELAFVRRLRRLRPAVAHYYMGFYIHSCPKMRYKAKYSASSLLCPETYK